MRNGRLFPFLILFETEELNVGIQKKQRMMKNVLMTIGMLAAIYQLIQTKFVIFPTDMHKSIHLTFCMVIVFLLHVNFEKKWYHYNNLVSIIGVVASIVAGVYIHINYYTLVNRMGSLNIMDLIIGITVIVFCLYASWRDWGWTIPVIVLAGIAYALFGQYLPGSWFHAGVSFKRMIGSASMYMSGIYGSLLRISAQEVVMFIMFGAVLDASGGGELFISLAKLVSRHLRSGVAQVAVIGSALFGTISGNIAANVATTGAITIPSMKKSGILPEYAGAVEAVASTGGQLMPPVMGVAAFLIVGLSGIPYTQVMKAALFPALAFYIYIGISIHIRSCKQRWIPNAEATTVKKIEGGLLKNYWHIFISFIVLGICIGSGISAVLMANYITVTLLITTTIKIIFEYKKNNEESLIKQLGNFFLEALPKGIITCSKLTVSICTLGILVEVFTLTGFAQTFAFNMVRLAGNSLLILAILTFLTCTFFGMGMTATSSYLLVAMLGVPAMIKFGVPVLAAHMFCFYYGIMSSVTPPVARGVLVANGMAGGSFWKTAGYSVRLALPGFLLPFYFIYKPEILWGEGTIFATLYIFAIAMCGLLALNSLFERYLFTKLNMLDRILLVAIVICSLLPFTVTNILTIILSAVEVAQQYIRYRNIPKDDDGISFSSAAAEK